MFCQLAKSVNPKPLLLNLLDRCKSVSNNFDGDESAIRVAVLRKVIQILIPNSNSRQAPRHVCSMQMCHQDCAHLDLVNLPITCIYHQDRDEGASQ